MISTKKPPDRGDSIDEYDLVERFKRWSKEATSKAVTFVLVHPKPVAYSVVGTLILGITWWVVANYRPAEPPPPRARPMRMMMKSVEDADQRLRSQRGQGVEQQGDLQGVFETMRDMPVPMSTDSGAGANKTEGQP
jgi:hypothetical protein